MAAEPVPVLQSHHAVAAPLWALLQRHLLATMSEAALWFVDRYTRPDGTLAWRERWPGMDGSDDAYESFQALPLLYALGGAEPLLGVARRQWDAVTWQFTQYGQLEREFDGYYDWMHHGESAHYLYYLGLCDAGAGAAKERQRAVRFAAMYTGEDPLAPNYDPALRLMRSPLTGSRGPRLQMSAEDWSTHRAVLDGYPPPFEDVPGAPGPLCRWTDDAVFAAVLERINARMARGDVPLNLMATSLLTHAFLHTGQESYRRWVLDYLAAWEDRARANGGLLPDNVGPSGRIGECLDGRWWGGYYGWRWPHGGQILLQAAAVAGCNALLLTGDGGRCGLIRSQLDRLWDLGRDGAGGRLVPNRHLDAGWTDFRPASPELAIHLWNATQAAEDARRVDRCPGQEGWGELADRIGKGDQAHTAAWYRYAGGACPDHPERILRLDERHVAARLQAIREDRGDPAGWDVHHWQDLSPVLCEGLVHTMLGAPPGIYHGGLLHCPVRYFDAEGRRAGLPPGVAALVEAAGARGAALRLVNTDPLHARSVVIQGGAFGEHRLLRARDLDAGEDPATEIGGRWLRVDLGPAAGLRLGLEMERHAAQPSYGGPWDGPPQAGGLLRGREA